MKVSWHVLQRLLVLALCGLVLLVLSAWIAVLSPRYTLVRMSREATAAITPWRLVRFDSFGVCTIVRIHESEFGFLAREHDAKITRMRRLFMEVDRLSRVPLILEQQQGWPVASLRWTATWHSDLQGGIDIRLAGAIPVQGAPMRLEATVGIDQTGMDVPEVPARVFGVIPMPLGFCVNLAFWMSSVFVVHKAGTVAVYWVVRRIRQLRGVCLMCGYEWGQLSRCPECGFQKAQESRSTNA